LLGGLGEMERIRHVVFAGSEFSGLGNFRMAPFQQTKKHPAFYMASKYLHDAIT